MVTTLYTHKQLHCPNPTHTRCLCPYTKLIHIRGQRLLVVDFEVVNRNLDRLPSLGGRAAQFKGYPLSVCGC
jgi:hypothetical protein